jgi:hypothetical protein
VRKPVVKSNVKKVVHLVSKLRSSHKRPAALLRKANHHRAIYAGRYECPWR